MMFTINDEIFEKQIRITCTDGEILYGICTDITSEYDNPEGEASISILEHYGDDYDVEIMQSEIENIEIID